MRLTPTSEQMAYLLSIGVSRATIEQPGPNVTDLLGVGEGGNLRAPKGRFRQWWAILVLIFFLLVSLAQLARGKELQALQGNSAPETKEISQQTDPVLGQRLGVVEKELAAIRKSVARSAKRDHLASLQEQVRALGQRLASLRDGYVVDLAKDRERFAGKIESLGARVQQLKNTLTESADQGKRVEELAELLTSTAEKAEAQIAQVKHSAQESFKTDIAALHQELDQQRKGFNGTMVMFVVICVLATGLLVTGRILMEKRIRQIELNAMSRLSERRAIAGALHEATPGAAMDAHTAKKASRDEKVNIEPTRSQSKPLPSPVEQMQAIIDSAAKVSHIRVKPRLSTVPWGLGLATAKGNVRSENQDYGLCFQTDAHDVLIVADGCGGVPHGQRAAHLAAVSAAASVVRTYGMSPRWYAPHVKDAAAKAIVDAGHRLSVEGDKLNVTDIRGGLRTTLVVVIGYKREIGYAYIGDGGGCVVRSSGEVSHFLEPQKANDFEMNVLAASLGPMMEGEPVVGVLKRSPGDLLIVGTDGVFDRVEKGFPKDVLRGCIHYKGDLQKTAEHIVAELASFQDSAGYICDDNLTLGIMGDGSIPRLSPGFWSPIKEAEEHPAKLSPMETTSCTKERVS